MAGLDFPDQLFVEQAEKLAGESILHRILFNPHAKLSEKLAVSNIQPGASVRALMLARELANYLVDAKGQVKGLEEVIALLQLKLYSLGPGRHSDTQSRVHVLNMLTQLDTKQLESFSPPYQNSLADHFIQETLGLSKGNIIGVSEVRRAALVALLIPLRQSVGSCFATAVAIRVQQQEPQRLLTDLLELVSKGSLRRIIEGNEAFIPLSPNWGNGNLFDPLHLPCSIPPGIWRALEVGGIFHPQDSCLTKEAFSQTILRKIAREAPITTPEQIIKQCVPFDRIQQAFEAFKGFADCALLKSWEYTLASFAELKTPLRNLYISLGLHPNEKEGIGEQVHIFLQEKIEETSRELEGLKIDYETVFSYAKYQEARLTRSFGEEGEFRRSLGKLDELKKKGDRLQTKAQKIADLWPNLAEAYIRLFPNYFQEVYDPEMQDHKARLYEDASAGFRLLYKHGRKTPSTWTLIRGPDEFVSALTHFFTLSESLLAEEEWVVEGLLSPLVGVIIRHVRSTPFLESAIFRMGAAHNEEVPKEPLTHLIHVKKKPWAYLSGGTMEELADAYYERKAILKKRNIESVIDLVFFLLDTMKGLPPKASDLFLKDPVRSFLMHSPTHAFLFKPGLTPFCEGWLDRGNTLSWIRNRVISPAERFWESLWLTSPMMVRLVEQLAQRLPLPLRKGWIELSGGVAKGRLRPFDFRFALIDKALKDPIFSKLSELTSGQWIDSLLYTSLPFCLAGEVRGCLKEIFDTSIENDLTLPPLISADQLHKLSLAQAMKEVGGAYASEDLALKIRLMASEKGYAAPPPLLFADTNWQEAYFGFVVNPGSQKLSLWQVDPLGLSGTPMTEWESSLDGSSPDPWVIYIEDPV